MSMTTQPSRTFPATASHGNPVPVPAISDQACARAFARARAIRSSMRGATSLMLVAPSAIAAAIEISTIPRSSSGDVPFFLSALDSPPVSPV
jgi:hypothetical protein